VKLAFGIKVLGTEQRRAHDDRFNYKTKRPIRSKIC
jgi:hypothetical protein